MEEKAQPIQILDAAGVENTDDVRHDKPEEVHTQTPIAVLQAIGAELEMDPNLLSREKLMADPKDDTPSSNI